MYVLIGTKDRRLTWKREREREEEKKGKIINFFGGKQNPGMTGPACGQAGRQEASARMIKVFAGSSRDIPAKP